VGGNGLPVIWDGQRLRVPGGDEAAEGKPMAAGWHVCSAHPFDPDVLLFGPLEEYAPLAALNQLLTAWAGLPTWRRMFGLFPRETARELSRAV
jgi:hypothetical protein